MAIVTAPLMSASASGPVNGLHFQTHGGSTRVGLRPGSSWPLTGATAPVRANQAHLSRVWAQIDQETQKLWANPVFGTESGYHNWLACAHRMMLIGGDPQPSYFGQPATIRPPAPDFTLSGPNNHTLLAEWVDPGECFPWPFFYFSLSTLHRSTISPRKYVFSGIAQPFDCKAQFGLQDGYKTLFWRVDWVDSNCMALLCRHYGRVRLTA